MTEKRTDRGQVGEAKHVSDNWHFSLLSFSACPGPSLFSVSWPSGPSICLFSLSLIFHSPWPEPSKSRQHTAHPPRVPACWGSCLRAQLYLTYQLIAARRAIQKRTQTHTHPSYRLHLHCSLNNSHYVTFLHVHKQQLSYIQRRVSWIHVLNQTKLKKRHAGW